MAWPRFLVFNASGGVIWATGYGVGAYLAGDRLTKLSAPVDLGLAGVALAVIVAGVLILRRKEAELIVEAEKALPGPLEEP